MKKTFLLLIFVCYGIVAFGQLKVASDGKVAIGLNQSQTPISNFTVGSIGQQYMRSMFESDIVTMKIHCLGNSPYSANYWGTALQIKAEVNSTRGDKGIDCSVGKSEPSNSGKAIGIAGIAFNATPGYNYGVIGCLAGSNKGTGILGTVGNGQGLYIEGMYAGYFSGDVAITGSLTVAGTAVTSDLRCKQNIVYLGKSSLTRSSSSGYSGGDSVLSNVVKMLPVQYNMRQRYIESAGDTATTKQGLFDEKSDVFKKTHYGLIAQELQKIYPDLVYADSEGYLSVDYTGIIPLLVQSVKELKVEVDELKETNKSLTKAAQVGQSLSATTAAETAVLYQNTPNPFSQSTQIQYYLPVSVAKACICIYNLEGRQLKQIVIAGRGDGAVAISASELSPGIYLYALLADGNEAGVKRMILTE